MCILSEKYNLPVINNVILCTSLLFLCMLTFEMHGNLIYVNGNNKNTNEWKYIFNPHKKRLHITIWTFFLGRGFIRYFDKNLN